MIHAPLESLNTLLISSLLIGFIALAFMDWLPINRRFVTSVINRQTTDRFFLNLLEAVEVERLLNRFAPVRVSIIIACYLSKWTAMMAMRVCRLRSR